MTHRGRSKRRHERNKQLVCHSCLGISLGYPYACDRLVLEILACLVYLQRLGLPGCLAFPHPLYLEAWTDPCEETCICRPFGIFLISKRLQVAWIFFLGGLGDFERGLCRNLHSSPRLHLPLRKSRQTCFSWLGCLMELRLGVLDLEDLDVLTDLPLRRLSPPGERPDLSLVALNPGAPYLSP